MHDLQHLTAEDDSRRSRLVPALYQDKYFCGPSVHTPVEGKFLSVTIVQHRKEIPNPHKFLRNLIHY